MTLRTTTPYHIGLCLTAVLALSACGEKKTELGQGSSEVTGSAGPAGAKGASKSLTQCTAPVATLALVENPNGYTLQSSYNLPTSPVPLIRLLAQQSGCFRVVDRASGLKSVIQEQDLQAQGIIRKNTTVHKGKGYEAQYTMIPSLTFSESRAGGGIGAIMGMIPFLKNFTGYAEKVTFKEAQVALLLTDNETTEQIAAATGAAKSTDLGMGGLSFGAGGGGLGAGWSNTNEAKVIVAAFLDAHNKLVSQVQHLQSKELPPAVPKK
ncbi:CsgG/HfaB family protein [Undibacterium rugosum]|uniref:Curli production assembly/transport component CsgG n=1 Tax=Undibacterium rugosum TaxID=2762291 RepID=A0A923HZ00_9BURK|nr:CsgG/HfaB family protein [Undibacterium rugosum]MBC3934769.1 curli production assembly/transport component CsgG [Undibacterium rugosum]MBR7778381.1 curli production assembly/transport component CsgG [Undibacterium rugosum]